MMKRTMIILAAVVCITLTAFGPAITQATSSAGSITGTASGDLPEGATLDGISVDAFEMAAGVFVEGDGAAVGVFHATLSGRSVTGVQNVVIDGTATRGGMSANGASFGGFASMDLGNGLPPLGGIPFDVDAGSGAVTLHIQNLSLPAEFDQGSLTIE
jgi:hypothetical protein